MKNLIEDGGYLIFFHGVDDHPGSFHLQGVAGSGNAIIITSFRQIYSR
jgi:hypothetical protein